MELADLPADVHIFRKQNHKLFCSLACYRIDSGNHGTFLQRTGDTLVVPMVIPLVPGKDLYDTMLAFVGNDAARMISCGNLLFWEVCAMSMGMIIAACIMQIAWKIVLYYKK